MTDIRSRLMAAMALAGLGLLGACAQPVATPIPPSASTRSGDTALPAPPATTTAGPASTAIPGSASPRGQGNLP